MPAAVQGIRKRLLAWHDSNRRDLPWRRTKDPYQILVSEIMLQQTRVAAVIPYYQRFLERFPDAASLARAKEASVLRAWAGLGYYSRARNLLAAARHIAKHGFPATYEDARKLPGIGPYTAAAVTSIALGLPHAAVDGNVRRVLARLYARNDAGQEDADTLLDPRRPGDFNQAMMELGAILCLPRVPRCPECPVSRACVAYARGEIEKFPAPKVKRAPEDVRIAWSFVVRDDGAILLDPPRQDGLWRGFWTLPELELRDARPLARVRHAVTFRKIEIAVSAGTPRRRPPGLEFVSAARMKRLPLATPLRKILHNL